MEMSTLQSAFQYILWSGAILTVVGTIGGKICGDKIAKYKDIKIEEQQAEISKIRVNTENIKQIVQQRSISNEQQIALTGTLSKVNHKEITIISVSGDTEAKAYATEFRKIFQNAGWKTNLSEAMYPELDTDLVLFSQDASDSEICKEIQEAFHSNNIMVEILPSRGASVFFGQDNFKPKLVVGHKAN